VIQFNAGSVYSFDSINFNGQATTTRIKLRSSASPTAWKLIVSPTGSQTVLNTDVKDSDASGGEEIAAADPSNLDSGGNINWAFVVSPPNVTSAADDIFEYQASPTAIAAIDITSGGGSPGGRITAANDIRLRIPVDFNATWDTSITSISCIAGNACSKISLTGVSYATTSKAADTVIIDVITSFVKDEWVRISGLRFANFNGINAATTTHRIRVDGPSDTVDDATDSRTKTIRGKLTHAEHSLGQVSNKFDIGDATSLTNAHLYRFKLTPAGENITVSTTTLNISSVSGFGSANITNAKLFRDDNNNGVVDTGEPQLGTDGVVSITGSSGTITFGGSWTATTVTNIIFRADITGIDDGDYMTFSLSSANINAKGAVTLASVPPSGSSSSINHFKPRRPVGGGGGAVGGAPPAGGEQTGGGAGGGGGAEGGTPPPGGGQGGGGAGGGGGGAP
jgi:hypothetical protein